jgi:hypothetical protein
VFRFCRSKCHNNFKMKRNPRKVAWTKAYRAGHGKDLADDATFDLERRRNRPEKYNRIMVHKSVKAMKKILEIRSARQDRFYEARCVHHLCGRRSANVAMGSRVGVAGVAGAARRGAGAAVRARAAAEIRDRRRAALGLRWGRCREACAAPAAACRLPPPTAPAPAMPHPGSSPHPPTHPRGCAPATQPAPAHLPRSHPGINHTPGNLLWSSSGFTACWFGGEELSAGCTALIHAAGRASETAGGRYGPDMDSWTTEPEPLTGR